MSTISYKSMVLNTLITATSATSRQVGYTATNGVGQVQQATVKNINGSTAYDLYVYLKSDNTTSGTIEEIAKVNVSADTDTQISRLIGHIIPKSGTIQFHADTATDLHVTVSGIERAQ